jgi:hypothetical protein
MPDSDRDPADIQRDRDAVTAPHDTDGPKIIPAHVNPN